RSPDSIALLASGRDPLTYRLLLLAVESIAKQLRAKGISRGDRVAIVMPNGPEMAIAFLGVACAATSAPLNPAYRSNEFDFYLADLNAKALLIQAGWDSAARASAQGRGIPIIEISSDDAPSIEAEVVFAEPNDVALVLHTSGTTSRPKLVPLTHRNVCAS